MILCSKLRAQEDWVPSLTVMWIFKCTCSQFSLSVFKCCLPLFTLLLKLKHKSDQSSFILMSQVLYLLKSEYWNGLELGMFKGLRIYSACGAHLDRNVPYPTPQDPCLFSTSTIHFLFQFFQSPPLSLQLHLSWNLHTVSLCDKSFMQIEAVQGGSGGAGNDKGPGFIQ